MVSSYGVFIDGPSSLNAPRRGVVATGGLNYLAYPTLRLPYRVVIGAGRAFFRARALFEQLGALGTSWAVRGPGVLGTSWDLQYSLSNRGPPVLFEQ